MELQQPFADYIKSNDLFDPKDKLLLAVSGGIDSVVLTDLCQRSGFHFAIAHCNFQLRGEHSDADEVFVKALAQKYNVTYYAKTFDTRTIAKALKKSIEETARDLRYAWFEELRTANKDGLVYDWILTAHHADDNIETIAMNFFRGTGIKGLRGIQPKNGRVVRPLLFARKKVLEDYVRLYEMKYVEDHTNLENTYTRNYFRNRMLPQIKLVYPEVEQNLIKNIERLSEAEELYRQAIELHKKKLLEFKGNEIHIPVLKLKKVSPLKTIVYEIVKDHGFSASQVPEVLNLLDSESGKYVQSDSHRIIRNRNWLIIAPNETSEAGTILVENSDQQIQFAQGTIKLESVNDIRPSAKNSIACLDMKEIKFPLLLRKWKQGDYFYPLGMKKKKKLSRFFIDIKLSKTGKENVWVLETDKRIAWVMNYRIDDRFKITENTKDVLKITLDPSA